METKICKCCGKELPQEEFSKNAVGYTSVCKQCNSENRRKAALNRKPIQPIQKLEESLANAKAMRLAEFTPRELMKELKKRGYEGKLRYIEVHEVDIAKIND